MKIKFLNPKYLFLFAFVFILVTIAFFSRSTGHVLEAQAYTRGAVTNNVQSISCSDGTTNCGQYIGVEFQSVVCTPQGGPPTTNDCPNDSYQYTVTPISTTGYNVLRSPVNGSFLSDDGVSTAGYPYSCSYSGSLFGIPFTSPSANPDGSVSASIINQSYVSDYVYVTENCQGPTGFGGGGGYNITLCSQTANGKNYTPTSPGVCTAPPSCTISSFTHTYNGSNNTTLYWTVNNASSISINNGIGNVSASGSTGVTTTSGPVTYTLTCKGADNNPVTAQTTAPWDGSGGTALNAQLTISEDENPSNTVTASASLSGNANATASINIPSGHHYTISNDGCTSIPQGASCTYSYTQNAENKTHIHAVPGYFPYTVKASNSNLTYGKPKNFFAWLKSALFPSAIAANDTVQAGINVNITSSLTLTMDKATYCVGDVPHYSVTADSGVAGKTVLWSSTLNSAQQENMQSYGQTLDSNGNWSGYGGAWTSAMVGNWTKTVSVTSPNISSSPVSFTVQTCTTPTDGVCGSANGQSFSSAPATNLCNAGNASSVTGSGPWSWACNGIAGGKNASCTANKSAAAATCSVSTASVALAGTVNDGSTHSASYTITNSGGTALNWTSSTSGGSPWLSYSPTSGTVAPGNSQTVTVTATTGSLAAGTYNATITLSGGVVSCSPGSIAVTFAVSSMPATLQSITISPNPGSVAIGGIVTFVATGHYSDGTTANLSSNPGTSWSSSNANVATSQGSGNYKGIAIGTVNVSAVYSGITGTAVLNVVSGSPAPSISLSPAALYYSGVAGGSTPAAQNLNISNPVGGSTLKWKASTNQSWCTLSAASGTASGGGASITSVSVASPATVGVGTFTCTITVSDNGSSPAVTGGPQTSTVTYTVSNSASPSISLSPTTFTFSGISAGATPTPQSLTVNDSFSGTTLKWAATTNQSWCHVSPTSGTAPFGSPSTVTVSVDAPTTVQTVNCTITVSDNGSSPAVTGGPKTAAVTYTTNSCETQITPLTGGTCSNITSNSYTISWTPASPVSGFYRQVERIDPNQTLVDNGSCASSDPTNCQDIATSASTFNATNLTPSTTYYNRVAVVCQNSDGSTHVVNMPTGDWTCTTPAPPPPTPSFSVSANPLTSTVNEGDFASFAISITPLNGFNHNVTLSQIGAPGAADPVNFQPGGGATYTANPANYNSGILEVPTDASNPGVYNITITGTDVVTSIATTTVVQLTIKNGGSSSGCPGVNCGSANAVTVTNPGCNQGLTINWLPGGGATGYNLYRNTSNTAPPAPLVSNTAALSYHDTSIVGTSIPYYYWVETVNGDGTLVAANTNSTGGLSPTACPTSPGSFSANNSQCGQITLTWSLPGGSISGYYLYRNTTGTAPTGSTAPTFTIPNPGTTTYVDTGAVSGVYYYWVASYNGSGTSAWTSLPSPGSIGANACQANLSVSDKDITSVNGNAVSPAPSVCNNQTDGVGNTIFQNSDMVTFQVNLCNTGQADATNVAMTDTMTNLQLPSGYADFQARYYNGGSWQALTMVGSCAGLASNKYCVVSQTANPNQTKLQFNLGAPTVPKGSVRNLQLTAQISLGSANSSYGRFQNEADVNFIQDSLGDAGFKSIVTPAILFSNGVGIPSRQEIAP